MGNSFFIKRDIVPKIIGYASVMLFGMSQPAHANLAINWADIYSTPATNHFASDIAYEAVNGNVLFAAQGILPPALPGIPAPVPNPIVFYLYNQAIGTQIQTFSVAANPQAFNSLSRFTLVPNGNYYTLQQITNATSTPNLVTNTWGTAGSVTLPIGQQVTVMNILAPGGVYANSVAFNTVGACVPTLANNCPTFTPVDILFNPINYNPIIVAKITGGVTGFEIAPNGPVSTVISTPGIINRLLVAEYDHTNGQLVSYYTATGAIPKRAVIFPSTGEIVIAGEGFPAFGPGVPVTPFNTRVFVLKLTPALTATAASYMTSISSIVIQDMAIGYINLDVRLSALHFANANINALGSPGYSITTASLTGAGFVAVYDNNLQPTAHKSYNPPQFGFINSMQIAVNACDETLVSVYDSASTATNMSLHLLDTSLNPIGNPIIYNGTTATPFVVSHAIATTNPNGFTILGSNTTGTPGPVAGTAGFNGWVAGLGSSTCP